MCNIKGLSGKIDTFTKNLRLHNNGGSSFARG